MTCCQKNIFINWSGFLTSAISISLKWLARERLEWNELAILDIGIKGAIHVFSMSLTTERSIGRTNWENAAKEFSAMLVQVRTSDIYLKALFKSFHLLPKLWESIQRLLKYGLIIIKRTTFFKVFCLFWPNYWSDHYSQLVNLVELDEHYNFDFLMDFHIW